MSGESPDLGVVCGVQRQDIWLVCCASSGVFVLHDWVIVRRTSIEVNRPTVSAGADEVLPQGVGGGEERAIISLDPRGQSALILQRSYAALIIARLGATTGERLPDRPNG